MVDERPVKRPDEPAVVGWMIVKWVVAVVKADDGGTRNDSASV